MGETTARPTVDAPTAACGRCGAVAKPGRKFCSQCGAPLNDVGADAGLTPPGPPAASLRCPSCGAQTQAARKFCLDCGAHLAGANTGMDSWPAGVSHPAAPSAGAEVKAVEPATGRARRSARSAQSRRSSKAGPVAAVVILGIIAGGGAAFVYQHRARVRVESANSAAQVAGNGTSAPSPAALDVQPAPAGAVQEANGTEGDQGRGLAGVVRAAPAASSRITAGEAQGGKKPSLPPLKRQQAQPVVTPPVTGAATPAVADTQATPIALPVQTPPAPAAAGGKPAASAPSPPPALLAQAVTPGSATPTSPASSPVPLPAAPLAAAPKTVALARVGGRIQAAKLIFHPQLQYPAIAKEAGVEGLVRLQAVINKDGTIKDLKIISGHRLLARTAVDGVKQWRYQPTLLDGAPIEVETEIDVDFKLPR